MKKQFTSFRNMYAAVIAVLTYFTDAWSAFLPFATSVTAFKNKVTAIDENEELQKMLIKGFTQLKKNRKKEQATKANAICRKVQAFAADNNPSLFGQMKITIAMLLNSNAILAKSLAEQIYEAASNAMTDAQRTAYDITDLDLTALRAAIDGFAEVMTLPRDRIVIRKYATELFPILFADANKVLKEKLDNLITNFESNTEFINEYRNARIVLPIVRHTTIAGLVTDKDSGADLKNVKVTISSADKQFEDITNVQGAFTQGELNPELNWNVKFELPDYETEELADIDIKRGQHLNLKIQLKKIPGA